MRGREGAWVGWAGEPGDAPEPFDAGRHVPARRCRSPRSEVAEYYEGFSNDTLWPIYHDVIVPATFHRAWWTAYARVNRRFAEAVCRGGRRGRAPSGCTTTSCSSCRRWCASCARTCGSAGSTTSRSRRSSCSPSSRGGARWSRGCSAPTSSASSEPPTPQNFLRACRRLLGHDHQGRHRRVTPHGTAPGRARVRAERHPDLGGLPRPGAAGPHARGHRARQGDPRVAGQPASPDARGRPARLHQGHPPPAQGVRGAAATTGEIAPPDTVLVQVATPSRERVEAYRELRQEVEGDGRADQRRVRPTSARPPSSTCTTPTPARRWRRCSSPPTSCW